MTGNRLKRPRDPVELGKLVGDILTGQVEDSAPTPPVDPNKNQAAVELGRKGGLKGGRARADRLPQNAGKKLPKRPRIDAGAHQNRNEALTAVPG